MSPLPPSLDNKTKSIISRMLHKDERERATLEEIIEYCQ
jgi:serine/threonine protein kinase